MTPTWTNGGINFTSSNSSLTPNASYAALGGTQDYVLNLNHSNTWSANQTFGNATVGGTLGVTGQTTLTDVSASGNALVGGALGVTGQTTLTNVSASGNSTVGGTLGVTGQTTLTNVSASGNSTVGGTLGVTGQTSLTNVSASGNSTVGGTLGVTGQTSLTDVSASGNASVGGNLGVTGNINLLSPTSVVSLNGNLGTTGQVLTSQGSSTTPVWTNGLINFTSSNNSLTANAAFALLNGTEDYVLNLNNANTWVANQTFGNAIVGGNLGVTGQTNLTDVSASGNATVGGTLGVTGVTTLGNTLNVSGDIMPMIDNTFTLGQWAYPGAPLRWKSLSTGEAGIKISDLSAPTEWGIQMNPDHTTLDFNIITPSFANYMSLGTGGNLTVANSVSTVTGHFTGTVYVGDYSTQSETITFEDPNYPAGVNQGVHAGTMEVNGQNGLSTDQTWSLPDATGTVATFAPNGNGGLDMGDMLFASANYTYGATLGNSFSRLPIGSTGDALTVSGGVPTWTNGGINFTSSNSSLSPNASYAALGGTQDYILNLSNPNTWVADQTFGNVAVGGTLGVTGLSSLSDVSASGNASVAGTLDVTGNFSYAHSNCRF